MHACDRKHSGLFGQLSLKHDRLLGLVLAMLLYKLSEVLHWLFISGRLESTFPTNWIFVNIEINWILCDDWNLVHIMTRLASIDYKKCLATLHIFIYTIVVYYTGACSVTEVFITSHIYQATVAFCIYNSKLWSPFNLKVWLTPNRLYRLSITSLQNMK